MKTIITDFSRMILDIISPSPLTRESEMNKMHVLKTCSITLHIMFFKLINGVYIFVHLKFEISLHKKHSP